MYVGISGYGKARVIQFREDTRIPGTKKKKSKVIRTIGNYERMLAEDPDIIAKLKAEARKITAEKKAAAKPIALELSVEEVRSPEDAVDFYHFGHALLKQLWLSLKLGDFLREQSGKRNAEAVEQAVYGLAANRLSDPASLLSSKRALRGYAGMAPLGLDVFYQVLDVLSQQKEPLVEHLCRFFERNTDRKGPEAYYDVTTYAFESTRCGELRMFGFSKERKNNEVQVVMGLLLDNNGIPITYELFPGNTMDQKTLTKAVDRLKEKYRLSKIVIVADRGLNGGENLESLCREGHDFVISYTLKRASQELKRLALSPEGWAQEVDGETGEIISRSKVLDEPLKFKVPATEGLDVAGPRKRGRPNKYQVKEVPARIHLSWTRERAEKDRLDRERMLEQLKRSLDKPYQLKADLKRGRNQYLKLDVDMDKCCLDTERIAEAERWDGYYAIITNNPDYTTEQVCGIYSGLWQIEESFRILKTDLRARPVFVWTDEHIQGHFALCYLCLSILRYVQYLLWKEKAQRVPARELMRAFEQPMVIVQGDYPRLVVTPTRVTQTYLDLAGILKLPPLKKNMTITQFRSATKLDLVKNLQ